MEARIVNVVSTADLHQFVDLELLNKKEWALFDQDAYPAGYIKDVSMKGKVTVFRTGKLISVGASNVAGSYSNLAHAKELLVQSNMIQDITIKPKVRNIVLCVVLGHELDLIKLAREAPQAIYEPDQFPGLMARPFGTSASLLVFASGKMVLAGIRNESEIVTAVKTAVSLVASTILA